MIEGVGLNPCLVEKSFRNVDKIWSSPFSLIRTNAMNSGISFDIFTFKQPLSIVLELIATLCASKIYFEDSKIYQSHFHPFAPLYLLLTILERVYLH